MIQLTLTYPQFDGVFSERAIGFLSELYRSLLPFNNYHLPNGNHVFYITIRNSNGTSAVVNEQNFFLEALDAGDDDLQRGWWVGDIHFNNFEDGGGDPYSRVVSLYSGDFQGEAQGAKLVFDIVLEHLQRSIGAAEVMAFVRKSDMRKGLEILDSINRGLSEHDFAARIGHLRTLFQEPLGE